MSDTETYYRNRQVYAVLLAVACVLIPGLFMVAGAQAMTIYPLDPYSSVKTLQFNYTIPSAQGNTISLSACRNQTESASFAISSAKPISNVQIVAQDLVNPQGNVIPASSVKIQTVIVWGQAAKDDIWLQSNGWYLTPELIVNRSDLVQVDYTRHINWLLVSVNGKEQYVDSSTPTVALPAGAQIRDAATLQPFNLAANENKQVWITVKIPAGTPKGDYTGNIIVSATGDSPQTLKFTIHVNSFELEPSPLDYGLYYNGIISTGSISDHGKTTAQYTAEMQDMKDHGVLYPTATDWWGGQSMSSFDAGLSIRNQLGFPKDKLFLLEPTTTTSLTAATIKQFTTEAAKYGYNNVYFEGIDEGGDSVLSGQASAWSRVHNNGAKVYVAVSNNLNAVNVVGNTLDVAVLAGALSTSQATAWHNTHKELYSYANPQAGVENPAMYRKNYGFALWNAGYDGALDFAYQDQFGNSIYNDFDSVSTTFRDHVMAYPTTDGVIDTVQWEGWRAGVDDVRYAATLIKQEGSDVAVRAIMATTSDPATIRSRIIDKLSPPAVITPKPTASTPTPTPLPSPTPTATPSPTPTPTPAPTPAPWSYVCPPGKVCTITVTISDPVTP